MVIICSFFEFSMNKIFTFLDSLSKIGWWKKIILINTILLVGGYVYYVVQKLENFNQLCPGCPLFEYIEDKHIWQVFLIFFIYIFLTIVLLFSVYVLLRIINPCSTWRKTLFFQSFLLFSIFWFIPLIGLWVQIIIPVLIVGQCINWIYFIFFKISPQKILTYTYTFLAITLYSLYAFTFSLF